jgi:hypothetical protein
LNGGITVARRFLRQRFVYQSGLRLSVIGLALLLTLCFLPHALAGRHLGVFPSLIGRFAQQQNSSPGQTKNESNVPQLEASKPIERSLTGGESHAYEIRLPVDYFLQVAVEQRGIDVVVTLLRPDGKKLAEVDSPNGIQGREPLFIIAETTGNYRLEVRSPAKNAAAGRYEIGVAELRLATARIGRASPPSRSLWKAILYGRNR